ncbi:hypothetical protein JD844_034230 [Phrynosoma platyrhinos]|uniref:Uncharacterized protein n=1 Tax=Phrynosoma platyrhinos TaxID=52577 RepID=A0ABQ7T820_PHRPL|nr:hypothetical protein JD844_034230 [Phrynosoma platyrhinos]
MQRWAFKDANISANRELSTGLGALAKWLAARPEKKKKEEQQQQQEQQQLFLGEGCHSPAHGPIHLAFPKHLPSWKNPPLSPGCLEKKKEKEKEAEEEKEKEKKQPWPETERLHSKEGEPCLCFVLEVRDPPPLGKDAGLSIFSTSFSPSAWTRLSHLCVAQSWASGGTKKKKEEAWKSKAGPSGGLYA